MTDRSPQVLYVLGRGRSGSTILGQVLGAIDGFFAAGEVRVLWDPVLVHDSPCACGEPVENCPVWSQVLARLASVDRAQARAWQHEVVREARLPRLLRHRRRGRPWPALTGFRGVMSQVYVAITQVTGCRTIVDTSKRPSYALVVEGMPGLDPYFVHLVRDPRASAYSWRTRRHAGAAGTAVRQRGAVDATLRWDLLNLGAEVVLRRVPAGRGLRLRYEDFAATPRATVDAIASLVGSPSAASAFVDDRTVSAPASHALAGNPSRHSSGRITVAPDGEWWSSQRALDRCLASAVALPLLRRYGYPLARPAAGQFTQTEGSAG